ncbi:MAG: glycosyltransferase [Bacteroidales bacterium]|nr:MAG: glycosyltransferase [Bacteroidales bacterium]
MKSTRILYIIDGFRAGGKEKQLMQILEQLESTGVETGIITFNRNQFYTQMARKKVLFFHEVDKASKVHMVRETAGLIKEFRPQLIHTWDDISTIAALLPSRFRKILLVNGSIRDAGIDRGYNKFLKRILLSMSHTVVSNTYAGLHYYGVKGVVIRNLQSRRPIPEKTENGFNMVMTANFTDYKDHHTFLSASVKLIEEEIVNRVYLIGEGIYRRKWEEWIGQYEGIRDRIVFTGQVGDVYEFLGRCTIGVLCSTRRYREGLSNSVLEYMASGLVPVVTDIGASSEYIHHGINGILVPPEDAGTLIDWIRKIRNDPGLQGRLRGAARDSVRKEFDPTKNFNRLMTLYKNLLPETFQTG